MVIINIIVAGAVPGVELRAVEDELAQGLHARGLYICVYYLYDTCIYHMNCINISLSLSLYIYTYMYVYTLCIYVYVYIYIL